VANALFASRADRAQRSLTGKITPLRLVSGVLLAIGRVILSPALLLWIYRQECDFDDDQHEINAERAERPFEATSISVVPLSEFERASNGDSGITDPERFYVLMHHVTYSIEDTRPIGASLKVESKPPYENYPNIRYVQGGFVTDFASIPRAFQLFAGRPLGPYSRAAVVHDWAYATHYDGSRAGRRDCDLAMLSLMRRDKTKPWHRTLTYLGVRVGGGFAFWKAPSKLAITESLYSRTDFVKWYLTASSFLFTFLAKQFEEAGILNAGFTEELQRQMGRVGE
jgi:hypothetical protein